MSGFARGADYAQAALRGQRSSFAFRKTPAQASVANWWVDLSMTTGVPIANYYAASPLTATVLKHKTVEARPKFLGVYHGDDVAPKKKFLASLALTTPSSALLGHYKLLDYLLFYPFIDMDSAEQQDMDNTEVLTRSTSGEGVRAMMVALTPSVGSGQFTYSYINQDDEVRVSPTLFCNTTAASISNIVTSQPATVAGTGPFLPLNAGDTGIKQIISVTNTILNGGLTAICLVKPIADIALREINTPKEDEYLSEKFGPPEIEDQAYLNLIVNCAGSVAGAVLAGHGSIIWN
jgi:hypothetical protein